MECKSYIDGEWVSGTGGRSVILGNPADAGNVVSRTVHVGPDEAVQAIVRAAAAWDKWRKTTIDQRISFFEQITDRVTERTKAFANVISSETGKTLIEAQQEVQATVDESRCHMVLFKDGLVETVNGHSISYEPLGVVLLVTPSNFPLAAVMRKLAPALLSGNTAVVKASELTPLTSQMIFEILHEVQLGDGVANLILADGRDVVPAMIETAELKAISLTGATATGDAIAGKIGGRNIRFQAETGGSNVVVVLDGADLHQVVTVVAQHGYACAGQWCTGTTRVIVEASIYEEFLALLTDKAQKLVVGHGEDTVPDMGALISSMQRQRVEAAVEDIICEGAQIVAGGKRPQADHLQNGYFYEPTIMTDIRNYEALCDIEIFGPVIVLVSADGVDDALAKVNTGSFGLSFSIFTPDIPLAEEFVSKVEAGLCHINLPTGYRDNTLPLSGWKQSGRGIPECGRFARDFFTRTKAIYQLNSSSKS